MKRRIERSELYDGRRVYVKDLDVFGRVSPYMTRVVCEDPMPGYVYMITDDSVLYDERIGDRDTEGYMIASSGRCIPLPPSDPEQRRVWKTTYFADLYGASPEQIERFMRQPQASPRMHRRIPMPPKWLLFISHKILAPIGVLASIVYLWEACHR